MDPSLYPVEQQLIQGADTDPNAPFIVDVGGGVGHDLAEFKQKFPNHPGVSKRFAVGAPSPDSMLPRHFFCP